MIKLKLKGNFCNHSSSSSSGGTDAKLRSDVEQIVKDFSDICTNLYESQENFFNMQQVTYSELVELRDNGELVSGKYYRIIDYIATTNSASSYTPTNIPLDIIVMALTEDTLCQEGYAVKRSGYGYSSDVNNSFKQTIKIYYTLDNDIDEHDWADTENGKGVIYRMGPMPLFYADFITTNYDYIGLEISDSNPS